MAKIRIRFPEDMADRIVLGCKRVVSRTKRNGKRDDLFRVKGRECMITDVVRLPLWMVTTYLYADEGFQSPLGFERKWIALHPKKNYRGNQMVYAHFFVLLGREEE